MALVKRINNVLERFPFTSQGFFSGVLQVTGDVISQKFIEKKKNLDYSRCFNFMIIGFGTGLVMQKWYSILENKFASPQPLKNAIQKVLGEKYNGKCFFRS
jgi:hypothetical protein